MSMSLINNRKVRTERRAEKARANRDQAQADLIAEVKSG
ncbi:unnamed protein product, partial [marine sediment metagenome]